MSNNTNINNKYKNVVNEIKTRYGNTSIINNNNSTLSNNNSSKAIALIK